MIYYDDDLGPIIESIYLREDLDEHLAVSNIIVNPRNSQYIFAKTIIINDPDFNDYDILLKHGCKVISRIPNKPGEYQPYIIRPDMKIMWNGEILEYDGKSYKEICDLLLEEHHIKYDEGSLYFPKIYNENIPLGSGLSWALHQVGINYFESEKYHDLDVIKLCKKGY